MRRFLSGALLAVAWMAGGVPAALADPPGPTDYMSEVAEIEPAAAGFAVEIIGGDSFVLLSVDAGVTVEVVGYQGEPYLRFLADGTVEENAASPSKYLNEDRYAATDLPAVADAGASPDWRAVGSGGTYAWHDHRTHWMNPLAPPGLGPGDQVAEGVVPLLVEGVEVDVTVVSVWQPAPAATPLLVGLVLGGLIGMVTIARREFLVWGSLLLAGAALIIGAVAYLSVPPETQPSWSLLLFPFVSLLIALVAVLPGVSSTWGSAVRRHRTVLVLLAALELVAWAILHWEWLWRAILPTNVPFWLDRLVTSAVLVGGLGVSIGALLSASVPRPVVGSSPAA